MRILIALGGNALLKRGEALSYENHKKNVAIAIEQMLPLLNDPSKEVIITHGNGPQVGLLALKEEAYKDLAPYPFDVLGAKTQAMIGYMLQQELFNRQKKAVTLVTQIVVDAQDSAFKNPTKPIGPFYSKEEALSLEKKYNWNFVQIDDKAFRRVVASPMPQDILELEIIESVIEKGFIPICLGGGGVPVSQDENKTYHGAAAVVDKDLSSSLLAQKLKADLFIIATDVDGVFLNYGKANQKKLDSLSLSDAYKLDLPAGSMKPKVLAASNFVEKTSNRASIGSLDSILDIVHQKSGTHFLK